MAVLIDVGHAAIGLWQPGLHKGFAELGEPSTPNWFELHTRDYDAAVKFYRDVFKWDTHVMSDVPEFRYTTFGEGDGALAGIMDTTAFLPDGVPANWQIYFGVDGADTALKTITALAARSSWVPKTRRSAVWRKPRTRPAPSSRSCRRTDVVSGRHRATAYPPSATSICPVT